MHKKHIILSTICTFLPIIAGLLLWKYLPEKLPIHFDGNGVADDWSGKAFVVLIFPFLMSAVNALIIFVVLNDPKKRILANSLMCVYFWIIPIMSCGIYADIYSTALGIHKGNAILIDIVIGIFFIVCGCYFAEHEENTFIGTLLPWTRHDESNKDKTQTLAGKLFVLAGFIYIINIFILDMWVNAAAIILAVVIPVIYSFILYKNGV